MDASPSFVTWKMLDTPIIRKIQIKTTMRCHLTPVTMSVTKKSSWKRQQVLAPMWWNGALAHGWREGKWVQLLWGQTYLLTVWSSSLIPGCMLKGNRSSPWKRHLHFHVHRSTVHKRQETTWVSHNWWMDKENVVYIHVRLLCSHKNDGVLSFVTMWMELEMTVKWHKPGTEREVPHHFNYM
jgi:hypothetical protein